MGQQPFNCTPAVQQPVPSPVHRVPGLGIVQQIAHNLGGALAGDDALATGGRDLCSVMRWGSCVKLVRRAAAAACKGGRQFRRHSHTGSGTAPAAATNPTSATVFLSTGLKGIRRSMFQPAMALVLPPTAAVTARSMAS